VYLLLFEQGSIAFARLDKESHYLRHSRVRKDKRGDRVRKASLPGHILLPVG
jgi:hypothetical protein